MMESYITYLCSPLFPAIEFYTVVLLLIYKRHFTDTQDLSVVDVFWCNFGGIIVALCMPILMLSMIPMILLNVWWYSWKWCTKICENNPYHEIDDIIIHTEAVDNPQSL